MMNFHDYKILEARLNDTDIYTLIADCDTSLAENPTEFIRLLRSALSLSVHVLEKDKTALAHQLAGRLYHHVDKNADIKAFVDGITPPKNSLYPIDNGYDPLLPAGGMLVRMMKHERHIRGAKVLSDGRIVSWDDEVLRLWDANGLLLAILRGHKNHINGVLILSDGCMLSWDGYGMLQLWNTDGVPLKTLIKSDDSYERVSKAIELKDGRILSWHYPSHVLKIWDKNRDVLATLTGHVSSINGAIELEDGRILSWSEDRTLRLWDNQGHPLKTLLGHSGNIYRAEVFENGQILSDGVGSIHLWDTDGNLLKLGVKKGDYNRRSLSNNLMALWGYDHKIELYNISGKPLITLIGHTAQVRGVLELANGRILSWSLDSTLRLWDKNGNLLKILESHSNGVFGALQLLDGRILSWGGGSIWGHSPTCLWDTDGNLLKILQYAPIYGVHQLADGRILSWGDNILRLWDIEMPALMTRNIHHSFVSTILALDDEIILSVNSYTLPRLWHKNGQPATDLSHYSSWNEPDIILDNIRIMYVISPYNHIHFRYIYGGGYPPPYGYEWAEHGAEDLPENRLIYWQEGAGEIHIEDEKENLVTTLDEFYLGNRERIFVWLREYGINPDIVYPKAEFPALNGWRVSYDRDSNLIIYDSQTGKTIHTFYGESKFTSIAVVDDVVIAGDSAGRVIFLRWVE